MAIKQVRFAETASVLAFEVEGALRPAPYRHPKTPKLPAVAQIARGPEGNVERKGASASLKSALRAPATFSQNSRSPARPFFY